MAFDSTSGAARVEENCCWVVSLSEFVRALEFGAYAAQCCTLRTARAVLPPPVPQAAIYAYALLSARTLRVQLEARLVKAPLGGLASTIAGEWARETANAF